MSIQSLEQLKDRLTKHDWTYEMSDDSNSFYKGKSEEKNLRESAVALGDAGIDLYNSFYNRFAYPKGNPL